MDAPNDGDFFWSAWQLEIVRYTERQSNAMKTEISIDEATIEVAHQMELASLKLKIDEVDARLKETQQQKATLESVVAERFVAERTAVLRVHDLEEQNAELNRLRESDLSLMESERTRLKELEIQFAEVESFMGGDGGEIVMRLESELAEAKLALAEAESEKDQLEHELAALQNDIGSDRSETASESESGSDGELEAEITPVKGIKVRVNNLPNYGQMKPMSHLGAFGPLNPKMGLSLSLDSQKENQAFR